MPIYEYACAKCKREFEVEQRITDDPLKTCPHCRSRRVKRLISQTSFVLKGGGWYSDLYSSKGGASTEKSEAGGAKDGAASDDKGEKKGGEKKGDTKPTKGSKKGGKAAA